MEITTKRFGSISEDVYVNEQHVGTVFGRDPEGRFGMRLGAAAPAYFFPDRQTALEAVASYKRSGSWIGEVS